MAERAVPPELPPEPENPVLIALKAVGRTLRRVLACNFQTTGVTESEHAKLAFSRTPVTSPIAQNYVAWRRSALWITALAIFVHMVVLFATFERAETSVRESARESTEESLKRQRRQQRELARRNRAFAARQPSASERRRQERKQIQDAEDQMVENLGKDNLLLVDVLTWVGHGGLIVGIILIFLAAIFWSDLPRSRILARWGWAVLFFTPVILAFLPVTTLMNFEHIDDPTARKVVVRTLGVLVALGVFVQLGAKVVAIFPGIIRSSMALKTLLPESATPGWIVALIAPIYMLVLMLMLVTINQIGGSILLIIGALFLMLAPMIYVIFAKAIVRPHSAREVSTVVNRVRLLAVSFTVIGIVLVSIFILDLELLELRNILNFILSVVGSVLLLTVVVTDFAVSMLQIGYLQSQGFQESQLRENLDRRFEALSQIGHPVGSNDVQSHDPPPVPAVQSSPAKPVARRMTRDRNQAQPQSRSKGTTPPQLPGSEKNRPE
ncbi:MAG: hypothetical protein Tsb009_31510 [Planctomycetaceae bacterium]